MKKVLYIYPKPRSQLYTEVKQGISPDDLLYGLNHLKKFGYEGFFSDHGLQSRRAFWIQYIQRWAVGATGLGFNLHQALALRRKINEADLVFATSDSSAWPVALLKSLKIVKRPLIFSTIGMADALNKNRGAYIWRFYRKISKGIDGIVYFGHDEGEELCKGLGVMDIPKQFIPFGVDMNYFIPEGRSRNDERFVLAFGRDRQRDWSILCQVALSLKDIPFVLITSPERIESISFPSNVKVYYDLPYNDLRIFIERSAFVVIPVKENLYSGGTISLLEAMGMGKAVIVSNTRPIREGYGLKDRHNVITVPPGEQETLREAITFLWRNEVTCREIGERARRNIIERDLTSEGLASRLVQFFEVCLKK